MTTEPVSVGRGIEQCLAIESGPPERVWWWGPGPGGCGTRNTGPGLFLLEDARITGDAAMGHATIAYTLPLIPAGELDVALVVEGRMIRSTTVPGAISLEPRAELVVPEGPRR